jgi:mannitol operon transcriptional antiterminator
MDVLLNSIQAAILLELLIARNPVFAEEIARKMGVSAGVVRHNIPAINNWLAPRFAQIISRPKFGYKLEIDGPTRKLLLDELSHARVQRVYSPKARRQLLAFELLCNPEYQTLEKLAEKASLSKSTLMRELSIVEAWLTKHHLFLQKRPRRGTKIVGQEISIRHTLVLLIMEVLPEATLMKLIQWGIDEQLSSDHFLYPVREEVLQRLKTWDLQGAARLVNRLEKALSLKLSDTRFLYLTLYWAVSMFRSQNGQIVSLPGEYTEAALSEAEMHTLREIIMETYTRESAYAVPRAEALVFLLEVFSSPSNAGSDVQREREDFGIDDMQVSALANRLVAEVTRRTGYPIKNQKLLERLTKHLSKMLVRFKYSFPIDNPFAEDIIRSYPQIWQATSEAIQALGPELGNLSQEEVSFLAMYFVLARQLDEPEKTRPAPRVIVVCPTGGVSVWMLVSRLKTEIPEIQIVANVSLREMSRIDKTNIDAIITTARNVTVSNLPVICVSPFLTEDEVLKIKAHFNI